MMYENIDGESQRHGVESALEWKPIAGARLRGSHTWISGEDLYDIPRNKFSLLGEAKAGPFRVVAVGNVLGDRTVRAFDIDTFTIGRVQEEASATLDLAVYWDITKNWTAYVRGENVLDEQYTSGGFTAPGAGVYAGASVSY